VPKLTTESSKKHSIQTSVEKSLKIAVLPENSSLKTQRMSYVCFIVSKKIQRKKHNMSTATAAGCR